MDFSTEFAVVTTTTDDETKARELARRLVEEKLAACVHVMPIYSAYRWKGRLESAHEFLLNAKTRAALIEQVIAFIKQNHTYETPEIIATPIIAGHPDYLQWLRRETDKQPL